MHIGISTIEHPCLELWVSESEGSRQTPLHRKDRVHDTASPNNIKKSLTAMQLLTSNSLYGININHYLTLFTSSSVSSSIPSWSSAASRCQISKTCDLSQRFRKKPGRCGVRNIMRLKAFCRKQKAVSVIHIMS